MLGARNEGPYFGVATCTYALFLACLKRPDSLMATAALGISVAAGLLGLLPQSKKYGVVSLEENILQDEIFVGNFCDFHRVSSPLHDYSRGIEGCDFSQSHNSQLQQLDVKITFSSSGHFLWVWPPPHNT